MRAGSLATLFDVRPGDTVVVWRLDRLGRSLRHLIDTVNALAERKVGFRSLTENIDTTTSGGKLVKVIGSQGALPGYTTAGPDTATGVLLLVVVPLPSSPSPL